MQSHPSYPLLAPHLTPEQGGPFFLVFNDLVHSQKWHAVEPHFLGPDDTKQQQQPADGVAGRPTSFFLAWRTADERPRVIVPIGLNAPLSPRWFKTTFASLFLTPSYLAAALPLPSAGPPPGTEGESDPPVLYTAIVQKDSSIVYYRIAKGVEKPHDVPE